jgi:hypothetical protein
VPLTCLFIRPPVHPAVVLSPGSVAGSRAAIAPEEAGDHLGFGQCCPGWGTRRMVTSVAAGPTTEPTMSGP